MNGLLLFAMLHGGPEQLHVPKPVPDKAEAAQWETCPWCKGEKRILLSWSRWETCPGCKGKGIQRVVPFDGVGGIGG